MQTFPTTETTFLLPGLAGEIEILAAPIDENRMDKKNITAIICHPHPLFGGTMHNKVVTTLARVCRDLGVRSVRFNFRGVGKSSGVHDEGRGELSDVFTILDWIKALFPNDRIWLAGFSFGAYIATKAAMQVTPQQLVTIAPQVSRFKEDDISQVTCPWLLVQGGQDEVVSAKEVFAWLETLPHKPDIIHMPTAGHYFHGQLLELRNQLESKLRCVV